MQLHGRGESDPRECNGLLSGEQSHDQKLTPSNCFKKRTSFSEYKRRSLTLNLSWAMRSIPIPKAKPVYSSGSIPEAANTFGSTIPQPRISSQPVYLQTLQPLALQMVHETSTSALGSVNGK